MEKNLILTGWGYAEYVAAAAMALKALNGRAEVRGVSRRRLPELLTEIGGNRTVIYILGVALGGDVSALSVALKKLKTKGVKVVWISALEMPEEVEECLEGLLEECVNDDSLLAAVEESFGVNVAPWVPYLGHGRRTSAEVGAYLDLIEVAQFFYRNYQDETLYETTARYLSLGMNSAAWSPDVKNAMAHYERYGGRELIGKSPLMVDLQSQINTVAAHADARVLILGESGTGKETVAQQIHTKSPRGKERFLAFNCASVTASLLESQLFGHEKGSFTGADAQYQGLFEQTDGGTLFLDEIGKMPLEVQGILLRVLEGGRFRRVGGREDVKVDVRLIAATNRSLPDLVRKEQFLPDLYMRLDVVRIRVPSLREHKEDIPLIANAWWRKHHGNHMLSADQLAALATYDYPGNVRELLNILERATALEQYDFGRLVREHAQENAALLADIQTSSAGVMPDSLEEATRLHVRHVYEKYEKNLTRAAQALEVSRNTVRKYL